MSYLARLKALGGENPLPAEPSKSSKAPFEPFEGGRDGAFSCRDDSAQVALDRDADTAQAIADGRNRRAAADRFTDRWCACGQPASLGFPRSNAFGLPERCLWACAPCAERRGLIRRH